MMRTRGGSAVQITWSKVPVRLAVTVGVGLLALSVGAARADDGYDLDYSTVPPPHPDCLVPQDGVGVTPDGKPCIPPGPSEEQIRIDKASIAWFHALQDYEAGRGSKDALDEAARRLAEARGEPTATVVGQVNRIAKEISAVLSVPVEQHDRITPEMVQHWDEQPEIVRAASNIPLGFFYPFTQVNSYFCGPATVESILFYIGYGAYRQSYMYDPNFAGYPWYGYPRMYGDDPVGQYTGPEWDQATLANSTWLNTSAQGQTNWGSVKPTLNGWMGKNESTGWKERWTGGQSSQAFKDATFDYIGSSFAGGWPVAENVFYATTTYRPTGFLGNDYGHWDIVYGTYVSGWLRYVQIGQVYGEPFQNGKPYVSQPYQTYLWEYGTTPRPHWSALQAHHGIVYH